MPSGRFDFHICIVLCFRWLVHIVKCEYMYVCGCACIHAFAWKDFFFFVEHHVALTPQSVIFRPYVGRKVDLTLFRSKCKQFKGNIIWIIHITRISFYTWNFTSGSCCHSILFIIYACDPSLFVPLIKLFLIFLD